ncbi:MAG: response regulator [Chitinophagaceae bacterium]
MSNPQPHILVVDDNQDILLTVSFILNKQGYRVSTTTRLDDLDDSIINISPNLILLDKNLGWADGCNVCRTIKQNKKLSGVAVIMFSAYYKKREECLEAGADEFIEKPFKIDNLLRLVRSFVN